MFLSSVDMVLLRGPRIAKSNTWKFTDRIVGVMWSEYTKICAWDRFVACLLALLTLSLSMYQNKNKNRSELDSG